MEKIYPARSKNYALLLLLIFGVLHVFADKLPSKNKPDKAALIKYQAKRLSFLVDSTPPTISYNSPQIYTKGTAIPALSPSATRVNQPLDPYNKFQQVLGSGFSRPQGVAIDGTGNIFVADAGNDAIKKISPNDGPVVSLGFDLNQPSGVAVDRFGNIYVADKANNLIRKIPASGAEQVNLGAGFNQPQGVAVDPAGNVYVADFGNSAIKKITVGTGVVSKVGSGFNHPTGVALDASGNIYVADAYNSAVKKITVATGVTTTISDNFYFPTGVAVDAAGNVYVADLGQGAIVKMPAGTDALYILASGLGQAFGVCVDGAGNVYIADTGNNKVKKITPKGGFFISPNLPAGLTFSSVNGTISGKPTVASMMTTYTVTGYNAYGFSKARLNIQVTSSDVIAMPAFSYAGPQSYTSGTPIAPLLPSGTGVSAPDYNTLAVGTGFSSPSKAVADAAGNIYVADMQKTSIVKIPAGGGSQVNIGSGLVVPTDIGVDAAGNIYVNEGGNKISKIPAGGGSKLTLTTVGGGAKMTVDSAGNVYFAEATSPAIKDIKKIAAGTTTVTVIGNTVDFTRGIAVDRAGNVFVTGDHCIRKLPAGGGGMIKMDLDFDPFGVAADADGNLYIANAAGNIIVKKPADGSALVAVGTALNQPINVSADAAGNIYTADPSAKVVYKIAPTGGYRVSPTLPAGLQLDSYTGAISGTPIGASSAKIYKVTAYNTGGSGTAIINITVKPSQNISYSGPNAYALNTTILPLVPVSSGVAPHAYGSSAVTIATGFNKPNGVTFDAAGNMYVADHDNGLVKKIPAGGGEPVLIGKDLNQPNSIAVDGSGNIYIADEADNLILKIPAAGGDTVTVGTGFLQPRGIAVDVAGNIYVADYGNSAVKKIAAGTGATTKIGSGFDHPIAVALDNAGNVYVADANNSAIKKIPAAGGATVLLSDGFYFPTGVAVDAGGNIFVVDEGQNAVIEIPAGTSDLVKLSAVFNAPFGLTLDGAGNVYVADAGNNDIKKLSPVGGYFIGPNLPGGLNFDGNTGIITGKATVAKAAADYTVTTYGDIGLVAAKVNILIYGPMTFAAIPSKVYGITDFAPGAVSVSPITHTSGNTSVATIVNGKIHVTGAGTSVITATNGGITLTQTLTVTPASLTITANNQTKSYGSANPVLTAKYTGFVNNDNEATLTTPPSLTTTATTSSLPGTYPVTVSGAASGNYTIRYTAGTLTVNAIAIAYNPIPAKVYGVADFDAGATSTAALTYSSNNPAVATIVAGKIHVLSPGTAVITASNGSSTQTQTLTVTKAPLTITAINQTKVYGAANPALIVSYSGFVNGDTNSSLTTQPSITTLASATTPAGNYPINVSGAASANYTITYAAGSLTVNKATLIITANNQTKTYGGVNPVLTVAYSGFVNGDTKTGLTNQPQIATTASMSSPAGTYPITASGAASVNYTINYVAGTLTVDKAALIITAVNQTKIYGAPNPVLTVSYAGLVNGDTDGALTTQANVNTTAKMNSGVGSYPITASGAKSDNYTIAYSAGLLTVAPAKLTIMAVNKSKAYGEVNPPLTVNYDGFINGDSKADLTTLPAVTTVAAINSPAGNYPIVAGGAASTNYNISYIAGELSVDKAILTIAANNKSKNYGAANPALTANYAGFVNGDTETALSVLPVISTKATEASVVGAYAIKVSDAVASNYTIHYITGTLTVGPAQLTITVADRTRTYGSDNPELTVGYQGFVNGDNKGDLTTLPIVATQATIASPVGSYPIIASGASASNYSVSYVAASLTITPALLNITADNQTRVFGTANPALTMSYSGFQNGESQAVLTTLPTAITTATDASPIGVYPITASGAAAANYTISYKTGSLTITATPVSFAAISPVTYGAADFNPGAVSTETIVYASDNSAVATIVSGKIHVIGAGKANITATSGSTTLTQTLTVLPASLHVTVANASKTYGTANPEFSVSYTGFVYGDIKADLAVLPSVTSTATGISGVGSYPITASGAIAANYTITYTAGVLTVGKAALTIAADNQTKVYGSANPALSASYTGFVNGDTKATVFTKLPALATTAIAGSAVGNYPITVGGAASANYTISYTAATLSVTPATLTITANHKEKTYGTPNPVLNASFAGFVNGDSKAVLNQQPVLSTIATTASVVAEYPINVSGALASNYHISYVAGTLAVNPATLQVTAISNNKTYGSANPELTFTYNGFMNGETAAVLSLLPTIATTATDASPAGKYPITVSGGEADNYILNYTAATLTVDRAELTIIANNQAKIEGTANPALTAYFSGFVNGDTQAVLIKQPNLTTTAKLDSPAGDYPITASGATAANYLISYTAGTMAVSKKIIVVFPPTVQASHVVFANTTATGTTVTWIKGNGAFRAVFISQASAGTAIPANKGTYVAKAKFGNGAQIDATGWYCIYNGTGTTTNVTGLTPGATYRVEVLEYNGESGFEVYLTTPILPGNVTTPFAKPTQQALRLTFNNITANTTGISWTSGNGTSRAVFMAKTANGSIAPPDQTFYSANPTFGNGKQVGTSGWYCIYNGSGSSTTVAGLLSGSTYRVQVVEYNGTITHEQYLTSPNSPANVTTLLTAPSVAAIQVKFNNTTATSTGISWTNGNGIGRAVFIAQTANGNTSPVNNTTYTSNVNFGNGKQVANTGWYCIYNGTGNTATVTGLKPGVTYRVHVVEYNGTSGSEKYLTILGSPANVTTVLAAPTVAALHVTFSNTTINTTDIAWTAGNGAARAVFIAQTANGNAVPADRISYTGNVNFGNGKQAGTSGWYCIYNGTGTSARVTGLTPGVTYRVHVVEYNGTTGLEKYLSAPASPANVTALLAAPTAQAYQVTFSNTTISTTDISWIKGNGAARAVFISHGANGSAAPVNNITYTTNINFGNGKQVANTGWYCIYNGTGSTATVTGLTPGETYRVHVVEYNGSAGLEKYLPNPATPANVTALLAAPSAQAYQVTFSHTTISTTDISWINGNGAARAVFISHGANGSAAPVNDVSYTTNANFGNGKQIGNSGWYCIYNGAGNSASVSGLTPGETYRVHVVEYNGSTGKEKYLRSPASPANVTALLAAPTAQAYQVIFNNTTTASTGISWNQGNGASRVVFISQSTNGVAAPVDRISYTSNINFGNGKQIGNTGWYCIYNGNGTSANVTGLKAGTTYRVHVVEYNGASGTERYLSTPASPANVTTGTSVRADAAITGSVDMVMDVAKSPAVTSDNKVVAANILSPNGDGKNDTWAVSNIQLYPGNKVTVFDHAGKTVLYAKDYANDWNGSFHGSTLNEGTYNYVIDLGNGSPVIRGYITVVRDR